MSSCITIESIPNRYKEWYEDTKKKLGYTPEQLEKLWLDHITAQDSTGIMNYIHSEDRGAKTSIQYGNSNPKETMVLGVKEKIPGEITVATTSGVYTFKDGSETSVKTDTGKVVTMAMMKDIQKQVDAISGFGTPFGPISMAANKYASYMLIGMAERSGSKIGPLITKLHEKAKEKSNLYNDVVNLVDEKFSDLELLGKIKATLKLTGDIDNVNLAKVASIQYESARRTKEILDTELPKLDRMIEENVPNAKDRAMLDTIFGKIGFGSLFDKEGAIELINKGGSYEQLVALVGGTKQQIEEAIVLKEYMADRNVQGQVQNAGGNKTVAQIAAVMALEGDGYKLLESLRDNNSELYVELLRVSGLIKATHEVVNEGKSSTVGRGSGKVYTGYDEHGTMDVYDGSYEFKYVTKDELDGMLEDTRWKIIRDPRDGKLGVIAREGNSGYQEGLGLNKNTIRNGIAIDTKYADEMRLKHGEEWLADNNIVYDSDNGYDRYRMILTNDEFDRAGGMRNIAHTLYRTFAHNKEVIEMRKVQEVVSETMLIEGGEGILESLSNRIVNNKSRKADRRKEVKPFLSVPDMDYETMKKEYPEVAKMYKPVKNISNYGGFSNRVQYVRKDMADMLIGYKEGSMFKDEFHNVQRVEKVYKELVQMLKLKLVVANPVKLAMDTVSNTTLLLGMDVGIDEVAKRYPEALKYSHEMSEIEGRLVKANLELAIVESNKGDTTKAKEDVDKVMKEMEEHPFYHAIKNGFVQSQGTSMLIKEFDTISGLQRTIDKAVETMMKDKSGNPTGLHDAVVWWMNAGIGLDDVFEAAGTMSKVKGTTIGEELVGIAERLKDKKKTGVIEAQEKKYGRKLTKEEINEIRKGADVVRYVSEFIAAPSSEIVRQGSRAMQMGDIMGRWTLYLHELKRQLDKTGIKYDKGDSKAFFNSVKGVDEKVWKKIDEKAMITALDTFIDYRLNIPQELKMLSDYGVLMFPSFWMRAQKVIWNLGKYHPLNAGAGLLMGDVFNLNGASIVDANIASKLLEGHLVHAGQDVLNPSTIVLGL